jgi:hypothetical protein
VNTTIVSHVRERKKKAYIKGECKINKINLIIFNNLENLTALIIMKGGSTI